MLSIHNNNIANNVYVPMLENMRTLQSSAERLSTGHRIPNAKDGAGELGLADLLKQRIGGTSKFLESMENANGYFQSQDDVLSNFSEMLVRAAELAASALDTSKNTADRTALTSEYAQLSQEMASLAARTYNSNALFGTAATVTIRIGLTAATDTVAFSTVDLAGFSLGGGSVSTVAHASAALVSIATRTGSLNILRARVGAYHNRVSRMMDYTRNMISNLENVEDSIRNVDVAREAGNFTKQQVLLSASQSVLAQSNGIIQSALQFFQ